MKSLLHFAVFIALLGSLSCQKVRNETMTIEIDCTGTYLEFCGKDYQVCNLDAVASFPDHAVVKASFRKIDNCTLYQEPVLCEMLHKNEGWVMVEEIE